MDVGTENDYGKDMGVLWAAYRAGSFGLPEGMDQLQFAEAMRSIILRHDSMWIIEDRSDVYPEKRGAVAMISVTTDGEIIRPHVDYFKWATKRTVLRSTVSFLNWVRFSKDVGLCAIKSIQESRNLFWRMRDFGIMVTYVGNGYFVLAGEKR